MTETRTHSFPPSHDARTEHRNCGRGPSLSTCVSCGEAEKPWTFCVI